ncbi:MAG TPA: hypothetical protein VNF74_09885 [Terriglobales bacterium]|nr:hypothetical protein [Terriglobales bacterium]
MANLLLRNLDAEVLARLRASARAQGRSLQAEIHAALGRASLASRAQTRWVSRQWLRRLAGSAQSDSAALIREDREGR